MIAAGTKLTFDARGTAGGWALPTADGVRTEILNALQADFIVESVTVSGQGSFYELMEWQFTARLVVKPRNAYGAIDDVAAVAAHAIYEATGNIASVGAAGTQGSVSTGTGSGIAASIGTAITDAIRGATTAIGEGARNVIKPTVDEAESALTNTLLIVGAVLVVGVFLLAGKTTRVGV